MAGCITHVEKKANLIGGLTKREIKEMAAREMIFKSDKNILDYRKSLMCVAPTVADKYGVSADEIVDIAIGWQLSSIEELF